MTGKFQEKIWKILEEVVHNYSTDMVFWKLQKISQNIAWISFDPQH